MGIQSGTEGSIPFASPERSEAGGLELGRHQVPGGTAVIGISWRPYIIWRGPKLFMDKGVAAALFARIRVSMGRSIHYLASCSMDSCPIAACNIATLLMNHLRSYVMLLCMVLVECCCKVNGR